MSDDALFPPTPVERLAVVIRFVTEERAYRARMVGSHPERADYWHGRVAKCDYALEQLTALAEAVGS